jgi:hypothetical protein
MKNLHLIPTDKPSRLFKVSGELKLTKNFDFYNGSEYQNIYITSDEKIKEGDWVISKEGDIHNNFGWNYGDKKIILTTDQDLIKDGVQAIDDEFLEWFVKNPSCEFVEIVKCRGYLHLSYMIIIPQEEPKQETLDFISKELDIERKRVHKQETLEEAALRLYPKFSHDPYNPLEDVLEDEREIFIEGAEWQAERMYSEEDMKSAYFSAIESTGEGWNGEYAEGNNPNIEDKFSEEFKEWFEQFKKKGGDR